MRTKKQKRTKKATCNDLGWYELKTKQFKEKQKVAPEPGCFTDEQCFAIRSMFDPVQNASLRYLRAVLVRTLENISFYRHFAL